MKKIKAFFKDSSSAYEAMAAVQRHCISANVKTDAYDDFDIGGSDPNFGFRPTPDMSIFGGWAPMNFTAVDRMDNYRVPPQSYGGMPSSLEIEVIDSKYDTVFDLLRLHRADLIE